MDRHEALIAIADGHTVYSPEYANQVCDALGVKHARVRRFKSDPPGTHKGLMMAEGKENTLGVYSLDLAYHVAGQLGLTGEDYGDFFGRGRQARAIAQAVAAKLQSEVEP